MSDKKNRVDERGVLQGAENAIGRAGISAVKGLSGLAGAGIRKGVNALKNTDGAKARLGNKMRQQWLQKVNKDWIEYSNTHGIAEPTESALKSFANLYYGVNVSDDVFASAANVQPASQQASSGPNASGQAGSTAKANPGSNVDDAPEFANYKDKFYTDPNGTTMMWPEYAAYRQKQGYPPNSMPVAPASVPSPHAANGSSASQTAPAAAQPTAAQPASQAAPSAQAPAAANGNVAQPTSSTTAPATPGNAVPAARTRKPRAKKVPPQATPWNTQGNSGTQAIQNANPAFANYQNKTFSEIMNAVNGATTASPTKPSFDKATILPLVKELVNTAIDRGGMEKTKAIAFLQRLKQNPALMKGIPELQQAMQPLMAARDRQPTDYNLDYELQKNGLRPTRNESVERAIDFAIYLIETGTSSKAQLREGYVKFFEAMEVVVSAEGLQKIFTGIVGMLLHNPDILDASRQMNPNDPKMDQFLKFRRNGGSSGSSNRGGSYSPGTNSGSGSAPKNISVSSINSYINKEGVRPADLHTIISSGLNAKDIDEFEGVVHKFASGKMGVQVMTALLWAYIQAKRNG